MDSDDPYSFNNATSSAPQRHGRQWPLPFDFVVLIVVAVFLSGYQPPRETGPFQTVAYIEHLCILLPGSGVMAVLCVSIARNRRRPRSVRGIAGLFLIPVSAFIYTPVITLLRML